MRDILILNCAVKVAIGHGTECNHCKWLRLCEASSIDCIAKHCEARLTVLPNSHKYTINVHSILQRHSMECSASTWLWCQICLTFLHCATIHVHQIIAVVLLYTLCRKVVHCVTAAVPEIRVIVMPDIRQGQDTRAGENCPALGRDILILHLVQILEIATYFAYFCCY